MEILKEPGLIGPGFFGIANLICTFGAPKVPKAPANIRLNSDQAPAPTKLAASQPASLNDVALNQHSSSLYAALSAIPDFNAIALP
jgi:hypothetical protein